jgi:hypothetical protein
MTFAPPNPADRVGQFVAPFEDRMLLAFEALVIDRERMGSWSQYTVVEIVDLYAMSVAEFGDMTEVVMSAAETTFDV